MDEDAVLILHIETRDPSVIPFDVVARLFDHYNRLIAAVGREIAPKFPVQWGLTSLSLGSVDAEARPVEKTLATKHIGLRIADAVDEAIAHAVAGDLYSMPFPTPVREALAAMLNTLTDDAPAFEAGTPRKRARLSRIQLKVSEKRDITWGTVSGIADGIDKHERLQFTLYDDVFDNPVHCTLSTDVSQLGLTELFGRRVEVTGLITSNPDTGLIRSITQIDDLRVIEDPDANYEAARGIWKDWVSTEDERLEALRRVRRGA